MKLVGRIAGARAQRPGRPGRSDGRARTFAIILCALAGGLVLWLALRNRQSGGHLAELMSGWSRSALDTQGSPEREPVLDASPPDASRDSIAVPGPPGRFDPQAILGIVLGPDGSPCAGAKVEALSREVVDVGALDLSRILEPRRVAETATDLAGTFSIPVQRGISHELRVVADPYAPAHARGCFAGDWTVVRLDRAASVLGSVRMSVDRAPVVGALITGWMGGRDVCRVATDGDGAFHLTGLPGGVLDLVAEAREGYSEAQSIALRAGEETRVELQVHPALRIEGQVRDAATGAPIAGARVGWAWKLFKPVTTDGEGRYVYQGYLRDLSRNPERQELVAEAGGYGRLEKEIPTPGDAPTRIDFDLNPARRCRGRVLDPVGSPVEGAYVAAVAAAPIKEHWESRSALSGPDGSFEIVDLRPDLPHVLVVGKRGWGTQCCDFPSDESERTEVDFGDLRIVAASLVAGVVVEETGEPRVGLNVFLKGSNSDRGRYRGGAARERSAGDAWVLDFFTATRVRLTNAEGRFSFGGLAPGTYQVEVPLPGRSEPIIRQVEVAPGEDVEDLRILAEHSGLAITGTVVDPHGVAVPGGTLELRRVTEKSIWSVSCRSDERGLFRFSGLEPGTYEIASFGLGDDDVARGGVQYCLPPVRGVPAGARNLRIALSTARLLRGEVLDTQGKPVPDVRVRASAPDLGWSREFLTDGAGRFKTWVPSDSPVDLLAAPLGVLLDGGADAGPRARVEGFPPDRNDLILTMQRQ